MGAEETCVVSTFLDTSTAAPRLTPAGRRGTSLSLGVGAQGHCLRTVGGAVEGCTINHDCGMDALGDGWMDGQQLCLHNHVQPRWCHSGTDWENSCSSRGPPILKCLQFPLNQSRSTLVSTLHVELSRQFSA